MMWTAHNKRMVIVALLVAGCLTGCSGGGQAVGDSIPEPTTAQETFPPVVETSTTSSSVAPTPSTKAAQEFVLSSPVMKDGGTLPRVFTCDGESKSPPLAWSGAPAGTKSFAVLMDHQPGPGDWHWYWTLWGIPSSTFSIDEGTSGGAVVGTNSVNRELTYAPPCSKGPGEKAYTITIFALSGTPDLQHPETVDRAALLDALSGITIGKSSMTVTYARS